MIIIVRMRGEAGTNRQIIDTFKMLGLKKIHSFRLLDNNAANIGMIKKIDNFVAWGEASEDTVKLLHGKRGLKSPKGGIRSKKLRYPKGNLGYCGDKINDLVKRMV